MQLFLQGAGIPITPAPITPASHYTLAHYTRLYNIIHY